jgi:hypothetical protein
VQAALIEGEALLALRREEEAAQVVGRPTLWERVAQLAVGDDLLLQTWALSEHVQAALGREVGCEEQSEAARERWMAGQADKARAQLQLLRSTPLNGDTEEVVRLLEERMRLAEEMGERAWWLADALQRGGQLAQRGAVTQAERALQEIEEREAEERDDRYWPWVCLLRAHVARSAGRDEEEEQAFQSAAESSAGRGKGRHRQGGPWRYGGKYWGWMTHSST